MKGLAKRLFPSHKSAHKSQVVYKGECSCGAYCIGKAMRNLEVRIVGHSNPSNDFEPARHFRENPSHSFNWQILCTASRFSQA